MYTEQKERVKESFRCFLVESSSAPVGEVVEMILENIRGEHRTLQQKYWSVQLLAQIKYSEEAFDIRNQASVNLAREVKKISRDLNYDLGLPRI